MTEQEFQSWLKENGFESISSKDNDGDTPAHMAVRCKNVEALKIIAEKAPETLSEKNNDGYIPSCAIAQGSLFPSPEILGVIAEKAPETLPLELFAKRNEYYLKKVFACLENNMRENFDGTKEYVQQCAEIIKEINRIVYEKRKENNAIDKENRKKEKAIEKKFYEGIKNKKHLNNSLKNLGKGKGE